MVVLVVEERVSCMGKEVEVTLVVQLLNYLVIMCSVSVSRETVVSLWTGIVSDLFTTGSRRAWHWVGAQ